MSTAKSVWQQFVIAEESTYGETPVTPSGYKLPFSNISGDIVRQNLVDNPEIRGDRNPAGPAPGNKSVAFSVEMPVHLDAIGWMLKHGVGVPVVTGSGPMCTPSKSGFNGAAAGALPTGLVAELGYTDLGHYVRCNGCKVDTISMSGVPEGVTSMNVGFVGRSFAVDSAPMDASPTGYTSNVVSQFSGSITEGGSSIGYVTQVDFNLSNKHDTGKYVFGGAGLVYELPEGSVMVSGNLTALFTDLTLLTKALNNTESSLALTWTSGTDSLVVTIPELLYETKAPSAQGEGGVLVTLPFRGFFNDNADSAAIKTVLTNTVTVY